MGEGAGCAVGFEALARELGSGMAGNRSVDGPPRPAAKKGCAWARESTNSHRVNFVNGITP